MSAPPDVGIATARNAPSAGPLSIRNDTVGDTSIYGDPIRTTSPDPEHVPESTTRQPVQGDLMRRLLESFHAQLELQKQQLAIQKQ